VPVFSLYFTGKPETASHSGTAKDDDLGQNIPEIDATNISSEDHSAASVGGLRRVR
jgi:hypothetical protein